MSVAAEAMTLAVVVLAMGVGENRLRPWLPSCPGLGSAQRQQHETRSATTAARWEHFAQCSGEHRAEELKWSTKQQGRLGGHVQSYWKLLCPGARGSLSSGVFERVTSFEMCYSRQMGDGERMKVNEN